MPPKENVNLRNIILGGFVNDQESKHTTPRLSYGLVTVIKHYIDLNALLLYINFTCTTQGKYIFWFFIITFETENTSTTSIQLLMHTEVFLVI